jgi:hypothetical protein
MNLSMQKTLVMLLATCLNICGADASAQAKRHIYLSHTCIPLLAQTEFASVLLTPDKEHFRNDVWVLATGTKDAQMYCFARREKLRNVREQDRQFYEPRNSGLAYCFLGSLALFGTLIPLNYGENYIAKLGGASVAISGARALLLHGCKQIIKSDACPARKLAEGREIWLGDQIGKSIPGMPYKKDDCIMKYTGATYLLHQEKNNFSLDASFKKKKGMLKLPLYRESSTD